MVSTDTFPNSRIMVITPVLSVIGICHENVAGRTCAQGAITSSACRTEVAFARVFATHMNSRSARQKSREVPGCSHEILKRESNPDHIGSRAGRTRACRHELSTVDMRTTRGRKCQTECQAGSSQRQINQQTRGGAVAAALEEGQELRFPGTRRGGRICEACARKTGFD